MEVEVEVREGQELLDALDGSDRDVFLVVLWLQLSSSSVGNVFPSNFVSASLGMVWSKRLAAWLVTDLVLNVFETPVFLPVSFVLPLPGVFTGLYLCSLLDLTLVGCLLPLAVLMLLSLTTDLDLTCF